MDLFGLSHVLNACVPNSPVVTRIDRLGGNLYGIVTTIANLTEREINVQVFDPALDTSRPVDKVVVNVIAILARAPRKAHPRERGSRIGKHSTGATQENTMSAQLENARNLYLRGICDGNIAEVHANYMGESYTQHSTGVRDGKEGFQQFFEDFFKRNPKRDIQIVRALEDGEFVFLHMHQNLNDGQAQWVTADIFRANEQGRIIEHWDVIDAYPTDGAQSDPIFGDFELDLTAPAEDNKKTVRLFLTEVMQNGDYDRLNSYVDEGLIQHNQSIGQGSGAYLNYLRDNNVHYDFVFNVLSQGDYVVAYSQADIAGEKYALFDIFRLKDGKIVEHWDNKETVPPRSELVNWGKF